MWFYMSLASGLSFGSFFSNWRNKFIANWIKNNVTSWTYRSPNIIRKSKLSIHNFTTKFITVPIKRMRSWQPNLNKNNTSNTSQHQYSRYQPYYCTKHPSIFREPCTLVSHNLLLAFSQTISCLSQNLLILIFRQVRYSSIINFLA